MWIARDKNYDLWLFTDKPIRNKNITGYWGCKRDCMELDSDLFPDLKWEDEPIEVCLCKNNEKVESLERIYQSILRLDNMIQKYNSLPWYKRIFSKIE